MSPKVALKKPVKAVLDACILYPTVLREILTGVAEHGLYVPLFSQRILDEWCYAYAKLGEGAVDLARAEAALLRQSFPKALILPQPVTEARLFLPDPNDVHVLATAIMSGADVIITFNAKDFPRGILAAEGLLRRDPDGFLWELYTHNPEILTKVVSRVHNKACRIADEDVSLPYLLKRGRLNRLAKAMIAQGL